MLFKSVKAACLVGLVFTISTPALAKEWVQEGDDLSEVEQDLAQCKYEAAAATAAIGTNDRSKTTSDPVSQGVSDGVARGMEQASLIKKCMKAKGYRKEKK